MPVGGIETLPLLDPERLEQRFYDSNKDLRKRIRYYRFCFQGLVEAGTNSILPIVSCYKNLFNADESKEDRVTRSSRGASWMISYGPDFIRKGLLSVLNRIGWIHSEAIICRILEVTSDVDDLYAVVEILMKNDPDQYRPYCIEYSRKLYETTTNEMEKWELEGLLLECPEG